jgi:hypothetical protein
MFLIWRVSKVWANFAHHRVADRDVSFYSSADNSLLLDRFY